MDSVHTALRTFIIRHTNCWS